MFEPRKEREHAAGGTEPAPRRAPRNSRSRRPSRPDGSRTPRRAPSDEPINALGEMSIGWYDDTLPAARAQRRASARVLRALPLPNSTISTGSPSVGDHLGGEALQNLGFRARQIVFGQRTDRFEKRRTQFVVEILGQQVLTHRAPRPSRTSSPKVSTPRARRAPGKAKTARRPDSSWSRSGTITEKSCLVRREACSPKT